MGLWQLVSMWGKLPYEIGEKRWQAYFEFEYAKAALLIRQLDDAELASCLRGRFLDVASGFGGCSQAFKDLRPIDIAVSLDILPYKQRFAKNTLSDGIGVLIADGLRPPFLAGSFDLALSFSAIEHMPDPRQFLAELSNVLRPGGVLIIAFPPFYSVKGGHISFPFIHYLPAPVCRTVSRLLRKPRQFDTYRGLNRLTVAQFLELCAAVGLEVIYQRDMFWGRLVARIPLAREVLTTTYIAVVQKASGQQGMQ
jgi:SAM-dependent methyltransferase